MNRMSARLAACAGLLPLAVGPAAAANSDKAYQLATTIGPIIEKCWIKSNDPAFADYIYSPEPNASSGPRILIVPRKNPAAAPALAIQINPEGTHVSVFGRLAESPQAGRISADLKRWLAGGSECS